MRMLSGFLVVLGGICWIAALIKRLTRDSELSLRWRDTWGAWAFRGSVFLLAGLGGFAPGLWKLPFFALALGLMTVSALIDMRATRRSRA